MGEKIILKSKYEIMISTLIILNKMLEDEI